MGANLKNISILRASLEILIVDLKKEKNFAETLMKELEAAIFITENGQKKKIKSKEVIAKRLKQKQWRGM